MRMIFRAGVAVAFGLGLITAAHADISIAVVVATSPEDTSVSERLGAEQAVADINARGGILGQKLVLEVGDDACDPKQAVAVASELVGKNVALVVGHSCSGPSISAATVYSRARIIQISPSATNPKYTDERPGPGTYRVCGRDDAQGKVAGAYIAEKFRDKRIAIVDNKRVYGKGLADETRKALNAAGVKQTLDESYDADQEDYSALVSKLKDAAIDVLYVGGFSAEAGAIARQMRDQGMKTSLISGDALATDEYWRIAGDAGEGTMITFHPDPRKIPAAADVVQAFKARNIDPGGYVLYAYAAVQVWAQAAEKAGSTDFDKVVAAMNSTTFDTVLGPIKFDEKGDVVDAAFVWYIWKDGKYSEM